MFSSFKKRFASGYSQRSNSNSSHNSSSNDNISNPHNGDLKNDTTTSSSSNNARLRQKSSFSNNDTLSSRQQALPQAIPREWIQKVPHLAHFDACVAAADALAAAALLVNGDTSGGDAPSASCRNSSLTRLDHATGLVHTSVLVSPDGTLLLVPPGITRDHLPFDKYFAKRRRPERREVMATSTGEKQEGGEQEQDEIGGDESETECISNIEQDQVKEHPATGSDTEEDSESESATTTTIQQQQVKEESETTKESVDTDASSDKHEVQPSPVKLSPEKEEENATSDKQSNNNSTSDEELVEEEDLSSVESNKEKKETSPETIPPSLPREEQQHSLLDNDVSDDDNDDDKSLDSTESIFSELLWNSKDDYAAAMFLGHDLDPTGDVALNGFSAKGWSLPATSFALRQTQATLEQWADFCHSVILARKESAVRTHQACDTFRSQVPGLGGSNPSGSRTAANSSLLNDDWELVFDPRTDFTATTRRCGPLLGTEDSSLSRALMLLEDYYSSSAEAESATWRHATVHHNAILPQLQLAMEQFKVRMASREQALEESSKRARLLEDRVLKLKEERDKKWDSVYKAEEKVTRRMEALWKERSRQREKARMTQLREQQQQQQQQNRNNNNDDPLAIQRTPSNEQVWDMVAAISDNMDSTSFEPMQIENLLSKDGGISQQVPPSILSAVPTPDENRTNNTLPTTTTAPTTISREVMEEEARLPELRAIAMAADEAIEDGASQLLTVLSNLDTTRRSARVAAETALLAAANAQSSTLTELIKLERMALQKRLEQLDALEEKLDEELDVRADLDAYISADKKDRGGQSHLGDDDDGGIASALAILSSHVDQAQGDSDVGSRYSSDDDEEEMRSYLNKTASRDKVKRAVDSLFDVADSKKGEGSEESELDEAVDLLCSTAKESTAAARRRRSTMCYALNSKRSANAKLSAEPQFEALVKVFDAILTSCAKDEEGSMSCAKMIMMLAQTFYLENDSALKADSDTVSPAQISRSQRIYIKSRLTKHSIWSKDDFWDVALSQQISESLTQSGVMSNFERESRAQRGGDGEYGKSRKIKWHDLSLEERVGAASQVHAVVFAQLGALAHSMIEFGCGLQRSCAFVRRMAIRNQLPSAQRTMLLQHLMDRWKDEKAKTCA